MTLTQPDFDQIETLVKEIVKEEINHLPTKDEFFGKMDEVVGELKSLREEVGVVTHQVSNHEDRITKLENAAGLQV